MTWIVLLFNVGMLVWVITGAVGNANSADCQGTNGAASQTGCQVGTTIGVGLLIGLWVAGDIILGIIWLVTRPSRRCPVCGSGVRRGWMVCKHCGFDFARAAQAGQPPSYQPPAPTG
jgi:hypothetical protein